MIPAIAVAPVAPTGLRAITPATPNPPPRMVASLEGSLELEPPIVSKILWYDLKIYHPNENK